MPKIKLAGTGSEGEPDTLHFLLPNDGPKARRYQEQHRKEIKNDMSTLIMHAIIQFIDVKTESIYELQAIA
jgi:hypothetical protein